MPDHAATGPLVLKLPLLDRPAAPIAGSILAGTFSKSRHSTSAQEQVAKSASHPEPSS